MKVLVTADLTYRRSTGWWSEAFAPDYGWALADKIGQPDDGTQEASAFSL